MNRCKGWKYYLCMYIVYLLIFSLYLIMKMDKYIVGIVKDIKFVRGLFRDIIVFWGSMSINF